MQTEHNIIQIQLLKIQSKPKQTKPICLKFILYLENYQPMPPA